MVDTMKISSNPEKMTTPGIKNVYRIINKETRRSEGDYIALEGEQPQKEDRLHMFHPVHTYLSKHVTNFEAIELQRDIFRNGELVYTLPQLDEMRHFVQDNLKVLWEEYKRTNNPHQYPVDLSTACWENKRKFIETALKAEKNEP